MSDLNVILVPLILFAGAVIVILLDALISDSNQKTHRLSLLILAGAIFAGISLWQQKGSAFDGMIALDPFSVVASVLFCLAGFITLLLVQDSPHSTSQFHSLLLLALVGMILLSSGTHFLVLFIGLEILSLSIYVLASFARKDPLSVESGIKYFLLGSFASGFFLYGVAFIYGASGSLQLNTIAELIAKPSFDQRNLLFLGIILLLVGYAFKISLAPFHMWTPDVYEGAPTPVTAFMAATVKAAALASLIRVFLIAFPSVSSFWMPIVWILSAVTMFAGNLTAIWQNNLKRLLAYSSIAHAGYMLMGLLASPDQAQQTILYYFAAYVFMNLGAFAIVEYLDRNAGILTIPQYQGLAYSRPVLATCMTLFFVSLGGLPPTAGFFGKFYLFRAVLSTGYVWIVILGFLNSVISFYYYLRVVNSMFTPEKEAAPSSRLALSLSFVVTLVITICGTLSLGLIPDIFLQLSRAVSLFS